MSEHIGDNAVLLALALSGDDGVISDGERRTLQSHVDGCGDCATLLREATEELADWATAAEPVQPSAAARQRLTAAVEDKGRFAPLISALSGLADMAEENMRALVGTLDDATAWLIGPGEGVHVVHVEGGPRAAGAIIGYVRIARGCAFPSHSHLGDEVAIVIEGELHDDGDGSVTRPGERLERAAGTRHTVRAGADEDCIYLVYVMDGIALEDDDVIGPDDPRI